MKKILATLTIALGFMTTTANAAGLMFTGDIDLRTSTIANLFGLTDVNSTFTAFLDYDDTLVATDGVVNSNANRDIVDYAYNSLTMNVGTQTWVYNAPLEAGSFVRVRDRFATGQDRMHVYATEDQMVAGLNIVETRLSGRAADHTAITDTDIANITLFDTFTNGNFSNSFINFLNNSGGITTLQLRNISVSAVPLPAGVWLLGSAVLGFMGLRRRKS